MKEEITEPIGYPDICRFRLLDMFSACKTEDVKKWILESFIKPNGRLQIIVATVVLAWDWIAQMSEKSFIGRLQLI